MFYLSSLKMSFIPVTAKLNLNQPLLRSSMSHDPSEIILIGWFGENSGEQLCYLIFLRKLSYYDFNFLNVNVNY